MDTVMVGGYQLIAQFTDVYFVNDNEGWVTVLNRVYDKSDSAVILHTMDGGETWDVQDVPDDCSTIWMLDNTTGYVGTFNGRIFKTTDGGENWLFHGITGGLVMDISFPPNSDIGYAMVDNSSYLFKIKPDTLERVIYIGANFWKSISCISENEVWFIGGASTLYYDGVNLEYSSASSGGHFACILFENASLGWVCGSVHIEGYDADMDSWVALNILDSPIADMTNIGEDHLWAIDYQGMIHITSNADEFERLENGNPLVNVEWELYDDLVGEVDLRSIHAPSVNAVYAVGHDNTIIKYAEVHGIDESVSQLDFTIYPNPCSDKIQISNFKFQNNSTPNTQPSTLELIDLHGRVVYEDETGRMGEEEVSVDVSHLKSGLYLLKLQTEDAIGVRKIIIQ